jgi:hypothetical protein
MAPMCAHLINQPRMADFRGVEWTYCRKDKEAVPHSGTNHVYVVIKMNVRLFAGTECDILRFSMQ